MSREVRRCELVSNVDKNQWARWINAWAETYPVEHDDALSPFVSAEFLTQSDLEAIVEWKFGNWPGRLARTLNVLDGETSEQIEELSRRAFSCNDDLGALLIICVLQGVGPALGSALLMAHDPARYTVIDTRALRSIRAFGWMVDMPARATQRTWIPYLSLCRKLRDDTRISLRTIDRALYEANGNPELPDV